MDAPRSRPLLLAAAVIVLLAGVLLTIFGRSESPSDAVETLAQAPQVRAPLAPVAAPSATKDAEPVRVPVIDPAAPGVFEGWSRPVPCALDGFVHDAAGKPAGPGSFVQLHLQSKAGAVMELTTQIDALGHFHAENLEPWLLESVAARDPERAPVTLHRLLYLVSGQTAHVDVELGAAYTLEGDIEENDSDAPVPGVEIRWADRSAQLIWPVSCTSDATGRFTLRGLNPSAINPYVKERIEDGPGKITFQVELVSDSMQLVETEVTQDLHSDSSRYHAALRVVPMHAAIRGVTRPSARIHLCLAEHLSVTDADQSGNFRFDGLPVGSATMWTELERDGFGWGVLDLKPGENSLSLLPFTPILGSVQGRVRMLGHGTLIPRKVSAERIYASECAEQRGPETGMLTSADGHFALPVLTPGRYRVSLEPSGSMMEVITPAACVLNLDTVGDLSNEVDFEVCEGILLAGRIANGDRGVKYRVSATRLDRPGDVLTVELDDDESFRIGPLAPSEYSLSLLKMGQVLDLVHAGPKSTKEIVLRAER